MDDRDVATPPWRLGLLQDLEVALGRLATARPVAEADVETVARWALVAADVRGMIAELRDPCAVQAGDRQSRPVRTPAGDGL